MRKDEAEQEMMEDAYVLYEWRQHHEDAWIQLGEHPREVLMFWPSLAGGEYRLTLIGRERETKMRLPRSEQQAAPEAEAASPIVPVELEPSAAPSEADKCRLLGT